MSSQSSIFGGIHLVNFQQGYCRTVRFFPIPQPETFLRHGPTVYPLSALGSNTCVSQVLGEGTCMVL